MEYGKLFYGGTDKTYCNECSKAIKSNVIRTRTCKLCGVEFLGGPRAFYCPGCRKIRQKEASARARKRGGAARPIGSADKCEWCGAEYIVNSGRQKYCSDKCQHEAVLEWQRKHKKGYNKASGQDIKKQNEEKKKRKSAYIADMFFLLTQQQTHVPIIATKKTNRSKNIRQT